MNIFLVTNIFVEIDGMHLTWILKPSYMVLWDIGHRMMKTIVILYGILFFILIISFSYYVIFFSLA